MSSLPALTLKLFLSFNQYVLGIFSNPKGVILLLGYLEAVGKFREKRGPMSVCMCARKYPRLPTVRSVSSMAKLG